MFITSPGKYRFTKDFTFGEGFAKQTIRKGTDVNVRAFASMIGSNKSKSFSLEGIGWFNETLPVEEIDTRWTEFSSTVRHTISGYIPSNSNF